MTAPYFADHDVTLWQGDAAEVLATLPAESVNCVVTSPPYYGLRDYGVDRQIGMEPTPVQFVAALVAVFAQLKRVLRPDGVAWLNIGDSYNSSPVGKFNGGGAALAGRALEGHAGSGTFDKLTASGLPPKNLMGIPWRVAFALQDDGWLLRNAVVWRKPSGMPESVTDRLARKHELVFLLSRSPRYWFDLDAIREPHAATSLSRSKRNRFAVDQSQEGVGSPQTADPKQAIHPNGKNPGDVWTIATQPFAGAHFATMPPELARRCIVAGCPSDGVVLDPFSGSGTTVMVARQQGRKAVGIELNPDYLALSVDRIGQTPLDFGATA